MACVLLIFSGFLIDCGFGAYLSLECSTFLGRKILTEEGQKYESLTNSILTKRNRSPDCTPSSIPFLDKLLSLNIVANSAEDDKSDEKEEAFVTPKRTKLNDDLPASSSIKSMYAKKPAVDEPAIILKPVIMIGSGNRVHYESEAKMRYGMPRQSSARVRSSLETFLTECVYVETEKIQQPQSAAPDSAVSVSSICAEGNQSIKDGLEEREKETFWLCDLEDLEKDFQRLFQEGKEDN